MATALKSTDYLYISGRIHAMENKLLTRARMERMLDARSDEEVLKVLAECGYPEAPLTPAGLEQMLAEARALTMRDLRTTAPDPVILDSFSIKYDYHNAKALIKGEALSLPVEGLLIDAGRYPTRQLQTDFKQDQIRPGRYSPTFAGAVSAARETLGVTGDPQPADFILDKACYGEMLAAAGQAGSGFLAEYVRLLIDSANLRAGVRAARMGRNADFLRQALLEGGDVPSERVVNAALGASTFESAYARSRLSLAAAEGDKAKNGGSLTALERRSEDAITAFIKAGRQISFGEQPLIGYLYAREAEAVAIRMIMTGRLANVSAETIRERLRDSYV